MRAETVVLCIVFSLVGVALGWAHASSEPELVADAGTIRIYLDEETGCQYVGSWNTRALTPRMNAEGQQICETMEETE